MKKALVGCGGLLAVAVIGLAVIGMMVGNRDTSVMPTEPSAQVEAQPAPEPEPVEFSGAGPMETATFELQGVSVMSWQVQATDAAMYAGITLHDEDGRQLDLLVNQSASGQGETRIRGSGKRFLKVNSFGCVWAVSIQPE